MAAGTHECESQLRRRSRFACLCSGPCYSPIVNNNTTISFIKEDPWRIFRIMAEFVDSFEVLSQVGPGVTVFGSARMTPDNPYYKAAVELAKGLAKNNLAIITGGGPGIMEAANKGASLEKENQSASTSHSRTSNTATVTPTSLFTSITSFRARCAS